MAKKPNPFMEKMKAMKAKGKKSDPKAKGKAPTKGKKPQFFADGGKVMKDKCCK